MDHKQKYFIILKANCRRVACTEKMIIIGIWTKIYFFVLVYLSKTAASRNFKM